MSDSLLEWMIKKASRHTVSTELLGAVVKRLNAEGLGLMRANIVMATLHPEVWGSAIIWQRSADFKRDVKGVTVLSIEQKHSDDGILKHVNYAVMNQSSNEAYVNSPLYEVIDEAKPFVRARITADMTEFKYSVYKDFARQGASDYYAHELVYSTGARSAATWLTDKKGGFTDKDIAMLDLVAGPLALILETHAANRVTDTLLNTYLGAYSGKRVLSGQIKRGDGDLIEAVIFFCDLRNSSTLAEQHDYRGFLEILNQYYEVTVEPVVAHRGEVLRFIGDASLAIFPFERFADSRAACQAALSSAIEAVRRGQQLNKTRRSRGEVEIGFGIGLHPGTVLYGNIGISSRLEFTVIGRAANEAARIESQCRELDEPILVSRDFVELFPGEWKSQGTFALRNIHQPIEIFSPNE